MAKFKVGDRVKISRADINPETVGKTKKIVLIEGIDIFLEGVSKPWHSEHGGLTKVKSLKTPKFIILNVVPDTVELATSLKEAREIIKGWKIDTEDVRLFEIKNEYNVEMTKVLKISVKK